MGPREGECETRTRWGESREVKDREASCVRRHSIRSSILEASRGPSGEGVSGILARWILGGGSTLLSVMMMAVNPMTGAAGELTMLARYT